MTALIVLPVSVALVLVLQGGILSWGRADTSLPPGAPAVPAREPVPGAGSTPEKTSNPLLTLYRSTVLQMSGNTMDGWAGFLGIGAMGAGAGLVTLFVDLPVFPMILTGTVSLVALVLAAGAAATRFHPAGTGDLTPTSPGEHEGNPGPDIPRAASPLPSGEEPGRTAERYWVAEPFSFVEIRKTGTHGFTYAVFEPPISRKEQVLLAETHAHLRDVIVYRSDESDGADHLSRATVDGIIRGFDPSISQERLAILHYYIRRDLSGYGPVDVLMQDPALEDISCNGSGIPVFVFHRVYGSLPSTVTFREDELNRFVLKLAQKANKQISLSNPMADATLPDGARIQITYSNTVSTRGSSFTVRKFRSDPMTPLDLIRFGTFSAETLAFLWLAIEHRKSILVVGGTASGKTSTMNALSLFIPENAKVVSLEDTREIQLPHRNWLPTRTREVNVPGVRGDIDLFSLLRACMRQRPEYIIVGEVRGHEAQTLFQAMNTGHATLSTIHAGSVYEAINRLTHEPINVPPVMFTALDLVIVQSIHTEGNTRVRRNMTIHEIAVGDDGEITPVLLFEWDIRSDTFVRTDTGSRVLAEVAFQRGWDDEALERGIRMREEFLARFPAGPVEIQELAHKIHGLGA